MSIEFTDRPESSPSLRICAKLHGTHYVGYGSDRDAALTDMRQMIENSIYRAGEVIQQAERLLAVANAARAQVQDLAQEAR